MNKAVKSTLALAAGAVAMSSVAMTPSLASAWGNTGALRQSYTYEEINTLQREGKWGNKIVFNSISNSTIGDEKNFVGARENTGINAGINNVWNGNDITVEDGKEYLVRLYVHNNNPNGYNGVSTNTRVAFNIPTVSAKQVQVNGYIFSDNATPNEYWDYVNFNSDTAFHLEYVYGSALIENNGYASKENGGAKPLSDEIVTKAASNNGIAIGYDQAGDGKIPGCYGFANYITIRVKAVFDTDYTLDKKVRLLGDTEWKESVEAKVGDKVEYRIEYVNTSNERHDNVMVKDSLPTNMRFVSGSTTVYNANHPKGTTFEGESIINEGLNLGNYNVKSNAIVTFTAEVVDKNLQCGSNTLINWVQAGINGHTPMQDFATVTLNKVCEKELPNTGPEAIAGGVVAAGSVVTAAGYYVASRRSLRK